MLICIRRIEDRRKVGLPATDVEVVSDGDCDDIAFFLDNDLGQTIESIFVFDKNMKLTEVAYHLEDEKC